MSLVELRVELPAYSHSFVVQVPESCTILDVKQEIERTCIGAPRVEGQRIIWRGRYLVDHEKVEDLWKSLDEPRIVHLNVHPSAWSSNPPVIPQPRESFVPPPSFVLPPSQMPRPFMNSVPTQSTNPPPSNANHSLNFINFKHQGALLALLQGRVINASDTPDYEFHRLWAVQVVERNGWSWPAILDEDFPAATEGGLKYERVNLEGQWYLSLSNPSGTPTALQSHALKVLTYTFPLISLSIPNPPLPPTFPSQPTTARNINVLLQQLGFPQQRVAQNPNQNNQNALIPDLPEMAIRPLLATLLMLSFRTLLLLYFVAPARKPVYGILILAWMIYEVWQPIRNFFFRDWRRAVEEDLARQNGPARPVPNAAQQGHQRPPAMGPGGVAANRIDTQAAALLDSLANINIQTEDQAIAPPAGTTPEESSLAHKAMTFVSLLAMTVHPAVWNRRRVALRQREGRIRADVNAREPQAEGEDAAQNEDRAQIRGELVAQYARRPQWVRDYMERVVAGDWVDDSD